MTHEQWLDGLKRQFDRNKLGYTAGHWDWFSIEVEYITLINDLNVNLFYHLAVRN